MGEIEAEACTAANKRSRKLAIIRTQIHIRKKILLQNINIPLTRSRKQRPVTDLVQELSDYIRTQGPFSKLLEEPDVLVGSRINHRFETGVDRERKWYAGTVLHYDPITKTPEIQYDEEDEPCDLSIDVVNGDRKFITICGNIIIFVILCIYNNLN